MNVLSKDCRNQIFSYTELESLKGVFFASSHFLLSINDYAQTILMSFKLEATNPTLSFTRLCNLQHLINQWARSKDYKKTDISFNRDYSTIEELRENLKFMEYQNYLDIAVNKNQQYLFKYFLQGSEKKFNNHWIQLIHQKINVDTYFNMPKCTSPDFKGSLIPFNTTSEFIAYLNPVIFPDHPATKDLTTFFLQNSESALFAVDRQQHEKLKELLEKNFDQINETNHDDWESLLISCLASNDFESYKICYEFIEQHLLKTTEEKELWFTMDPLKGFCRAWQQYAEEFTLWTKKGLANIAVEENNIVLMKALKETSFDFNATYDLNKTAPFSRFKTIEAAKILIEGGVDINQKGDFGQTALHLAIKEKNTKIVQFLLEHGASIYSLDWDNIRPTQYIKDPEILKTLLQKINFTSHFRVLLDCQNSELKWLVLKESAYRARYVFLTIVVIPLIYAAALALI